MARSIIGLMFTRYLWVLPLGAAIGAGGGLSYVAFAPKLYTAIVPFQVLPPQPPLGQDQAQQMPLTIDDTNQIINRQVFIFQQENFLQDILKSKEFHTRPDGTDGDCNWLAEHKPDSLKCLKRDLVVVPQLNAASFQVTMTARNPMESYTLVQAAIKVYKQRLIDDSKNRRTAILRNLGDQVKLASDNFDIKSQTLADYQKRKGIDALKSRYEIERNSLIALNDDYTRANLQASNAEAQYESLKTTKAEGKEVELSADLQERVDNDATLKSLLAARLNWEQEKASASRIDPSTQLIAQIDARLQKINEQVDSLRKQLLAEARARMEKTLQDAAVIQRFTANYLGQIRQAKEAIITGIGQDLLDWQHRMDELKEQGDLVSKLRSQYNMFQANQTDDTRVAQIDEPVIPDQPVYPEWWTTLPAPSAAGLALALIPACLLAWGYRRRMMPGALGTQPPATAPGHTPV